MRLTPINEQHLLVKMPLRRASTVIIRLTKIYTSL